MRKTTKIIIVAVLAAVLLLGVGYAAIQNITLNISGTAAADPSQSNFKVMFTGTPEVSDATYVTAGITNDTNATINVSGLTTKGQVVSATYTVQNTSTDLSADLGVATTNSNTEYFTISSQLEGGKTSLVAGEATTLTVKVELTKTPVAESVSSTVGVQLTAVPVQPGAEGSSGTTNDYSQTPESTLALVTNANIGDYINLGNNVIGTESTTDDWRILYKDGETVYVILADALPTSQVPTSASLDTTGSYGVKSDTDRDTLLNGLLNTTAWSTFTNGIAGATATGSPTAELLMSSYNTKNGTELVYTDKPTLSSSVEDYDLYVSNTIPEVYEDYWLTSPLADDSGYLWCLQWDGRVETKYFGQWNLSGAAIRPVVSLPSSTTAELVDGVWTVSQ